MTNDHEEEANFILSFSKESRITTFACWISDISNAIFLSCLSDQLNEIKVKLFGDSHTVCEEDEDTSDSHEDLNPLVITFDIFEIPNKISALNIFLHFRI